MSMMSTQNQFYVAWNWNDLRSVRELIKYRDKSGLDINYRYEEGKTALMQVAKRGYTEIVRLLLVCTEIDVNIVDDNGSQAIHGSANYGYPDITELLLCKGASVNTQTAPGFTWSGRTPLSLACECLRGTSDAAPGSPARDFTGCVQVLLRHGADLNLADVDRCTPFHYVCCYGNNIDIMDLLLSHGANINKQGHEGATALMIASHTGHLPCVELLVKHKANINAQNNAGVTALMGVSKFGNLSVVKLLILAQASLDIKDIFGNSALHFACIENRTEVAECLIRAGADVSCQNFEGIIPLSLAASRGHVSCVELLLSWGCKFDWTGQMSPLTLARNNNHTEVVRVLERFRADKSSYIRSPSLSIIQSLTRFSKLSLTYDRNIGNCNTVLAVKQGGNATFVATVDGKPEPDITWRRNGQPLSESLNIRIEKKPNRAYLTLSKCTLDLSGKITVHATNFHGDSNAQWTFQVNVSVPNHQLRLREIEPGKHTVTVVASNLCGKVEQTAQLQVKEIHIFDIAKELLADLKLPDEYFNKEYNVCFCESCHAARGDNLKYPRGNPPMDYGLPIGWCKFGLQTKTQAVVKNVFRDWHVAFHGTKVENVTQILNVGDFLLPGDVPPSGKEIVIPENHWKPDHTNKGMRPPKGHDTQKFYFSPSIRYAGLEVYAPVWGWKNPRSGKVHNVRVAFQVRIEPGTYDVSRHTVKGDADIDPVFPNSKLEWSTKRRGVSMLVGLLVKIERGMMETDVGTLQQIMKGEKHVEQGLFGAAP